MSMDLQFPHTPDPALGKVLFKSSNMDAKGKVVVDSVVMKLSQFAVMFWGVIFLGLIFQVWLGGTGWLIAFVLGLVGGIWGTPKLFRKRTMYVGEKGAQTNQQVLRFEKADALVPVKYHKYISGRYAGVTFNYQWFGKGKLLFKTKGQYRPNKKKASAVEAAEPWHFAQAAEKAWTHFELSRMTTRLDKEGQISFFFPGKTSGRDELILKKDKTLTLKTKKEELKWTMSDLEALQLKEGKLKIATKDGFKRFIGFSFVTNNLLLVHFLKKLYGIQL